MLLNSLAAKEILEGLYFGNSDEKIRVLTECVFALAMEVEALREAMIEESKAKGIVPKDSPYGRAYYETALLTHNSAGPSSGTDKLFKRWFSGRNTPNHLDPREALMLMRLGFSPHEISAYSTEAENREMWT